MPVIKLTCVRDLKLRVSVADVVSRVAALKRAGSSLKGLCPFHSEKTPSFHVNLDRGSYKCFGCGKSGDIIEFVRETEQLSFSEAVETLGKRFGIPIEYEEGSGGPTAEERSLRQEIFDLHEQAADFYRETFRGPSATGEFMRRYWLEQRRFPAELAEEFRIGAAAPNDSGLAARLLLKRYSGEALRQCGLFFVREGADLTAGALRPRFRGRLMIPIRDHQGRVVAFTARQTDLTPKDAAYEDGKYINSPETPIFVKGQLLFNLDRARTGVGEGRPFVLVEGQLDAMRCWQVGLKTAIAPQGTAMTEGQISLLRRYHPQIECFFDSDSAGQKAALRMLPMALKGGLEVRFLGLADAQKVDPDLLFLERGLAAYEELRRNSASAMAFACRAALPSPGEATPEQKTRAAHSVLEIIAAAESEVARSEFIAEAAGYLRLSSSALQRDFERMRGRGPRPAERPEPAPPPPAPPIGPGQGTPEYDLLLLCLHFEHLGVPLSRALPHEWIDTRHTAGLLLDRFLNAFEHGAWPGRDVLDELLEQPEEKALAASLLFDAPKLEDPLKVALEGMGRMRARSVEPRLRQIELAIANATADSNADPISLYKERSELQRLLRQPLVLAVAE
ncbi:MAG TPA: DNA primase [Opitutaceae bacterium]|jgi:DNA primase|nr:DNA primase [Opitutaceae bacterium]